MKPIIAWFANNHVAANLMMGLIILAGLVALPSMPKKSFPDIDIPVISITVPYLGAAPEEVEEGVCIRIEEELEGIEGVKQIRSNANEGMCTVSVELYESADQSKALDEVKNRVDSIDTFPEETEKPITNLITNIRTVLDIAITGPEDERALKELAQQIRDDITKLKNVTQASVSNSKPYEISIEVSEASLRRNNLTFDDVANAVRSGSLDLPGGSIKTEAGEILLRTKGQAYWGHEFENLVVTKRADGTRLYLKDVANVIDGFADTDQSLRFNGKPASMVRVARLGEQDIEEVSESTKNYIKQIQPRLPEGVELTIWNDGSSMLTDRLDILLKSGRQGFLMVLIVLSLFLRPRLAFWVSLGVPVAFLGALFLLNALGMSINVITLFGLILVLGILVDDAIVVGESVHSRHQEGVNRLAGAIEGTQRVTIPVTFGVLTTVAAFMPLLFGVGQMGEIMSVIATTVMCCLVFSLVESQFVLPAHLGHSKVKSAAGEVSMMLVPIISIILMGIAWDTRSFIAMAIAITSLLFALHVAGFFEPVAARLIKLQGKFADGLQYFIENQFRAAATAALEARYITVAFAFAALLSAFAIIASGRLPFSFFPPLASDQVVASLTMPLGTNADKTNRAVLRLEQSAEEVKRRLIDKYPDAPPVRQILTALGSRPSSGFGPPTTTITSTGTSNGHLGEVVMQLTPSETRELLTREVADIWREVNGPIADAVELKFNSSFFSVGNDIDIQLEGDNVDELRTIAEKLRHKLAEYPGVVDITDSFRSGKQELKLSILPSGEALGLTLGSLAKQVRQAFYGEEAQRIQRGRDDVRVMVRYTEKERRSLGSLGSMRIRTPDGSEVPFATVAKADIGRGFSTIRRADSRRVVNVVADVDRTQITSNAVLADLRAGPIQEIMAPYPRVSYSLEGAQADQSETLESLVPLFAMTMFVIFALLAIPLRSYLQPFIIMSVIPFAFVGAIWGHLIMKTFGYVSGLAMMSGLGFVAATGVVVNSSLVLVHSVNFRRSSGENIHDAVLHASISRCRPIILTSLTTFVGLMPLMFNKSVGAQFLVPMAVSLSFGVMFATVVTLLVVPSGYLILNDLVNFTRRSLISLSQSARPPTTSQ
jgi:multidrug efflux pump subunit AcrB